MENDHEALSKPQMRPLPWNKGKLIGPKPPLRPSQVWAIRTRLQMELTGRKPGQVLFFGRDPSRGLTTRQYARLVQEWVASIALFAIRGTFIAPDQSRSNLPPDRQSSRIAASLGPHQDREHSAAPGHRD